MSIGALAPATTWPTIVGRVLIRAREERGLQQAQLAAAVGVTQSTWSRIERGESALTVDQLALAAASLRTTPEAIIGRASTVRAHLQQRGIRVESTRRASATSSVFVLIGAAALAALVAAALADAPSVQPRRRSRGRP